MWYNRCTTEFGNTVFKYSVDNKHVREDVVNPHTTVKINDAHK